MNYEICKKLKDAGWNKKTYWFYGINETDMPQLTNQYSCLDTVGITFVNGLSEKIVDCYAPDLSELIEACGDKLLLWKYENEWCAGTFQTSPGSGYTDKYVDDYPHPIEKGITPEIAVANLWLKLHETS